VPITERVAAKDTFLPVCGGAQGNEPIFVTKGTSVVIFLYAMHRRSDLYGLHAELFRPERWNEAMPLEAAPIKAKWGYIPFHRGARVCPGRK